MAFLDKEYTLTSQNNFDTFLKSVGLPDDLIAKYTESKATSKLTKNGDSYTHTSSGPEGVRSTTFKSGVELEDIVQGTPIKTTYTVDGNTVTQEVKADKGSAIFKRTYNGDELVVTVTASAFDGVATRTYKA